MSLLVLCAGALVTGCKKTPDGMPPATEWQASDETAANTPLAPPNGMGGSPTNPHAALAGGADPHAGLDMGGDPSNPHAGLDMGGDPNDPHAGVDMTNPRGGGVDVTKLGLAAPDPDRALDPTHRVTGVIALDAKTKAKPTSGTAVFVVVKRAGPDGAPFGPPLAVEKLSWRDGGVPFELTDAEAMVAGTELTGDVVVTARYDQDSDALTKQPGDITGQVRVKVPADNIKLTLDTVLP